MAEDELTKFPEGEAEHDGKDGVREGSGVKQSDGLLKDT